MFDKKFILKNDLKPKILTHQNQFNHTYKSQKTFSFLKSNTFLPKFQRHQTHSDSNQLNPTHSYLRFSQYLKKTQTPKVKKNYNNQIAERQILKKKIMKKITKERQLTPHITYSRPQYIGLHPCNNIVLRDNGILRKLQIVNTQLMYCRMQVNDEKVRGRLLR